MRGHEQVITLLNEVLTAELTAINQYFIHGRMCENWGYQRLWKKLREESIGEMKHADQLIESILYLEGVPNVQRLGKVNVGETVPEQLRLISRSSATPSACSTRADRDGPEPGGQRQPRAPRAHPRRRGGPRELDRGPDDLIAQTGEGNYLAQQIKNGDE
jgi:bacterioferritin